MSLNDFCLTKFSFTVPLIRAISPNLDNDIERADMRIYPQAYAAKVGFFFIISLVAAVAAIPLLVTVFGLENLVFFMSLLAVPFVVLLVGSYMPSFSASSRASSLEAEVPFAAAYITVMSTGGISPFQSLQMLKSVKLLPNLAKMSRELDIDVSGLGVDPVTAIEHKARNLPAPEFRELMLGYASTLRSGGDVVHFLMRRTQLMFDERLSKTRLVGERASVLMEIYITVGVLLALGLYSIFAVSESMSEFMPSMFSGAFLVLFSYVLLPMTSYIFLWMADVMQPKYPQSDEKVYKTFYACMPVMIFLLVAFFVVFLLPQLRVIPLFDMSAKLIETLTAYFKLEKGFEASIGLCLAFLIPTLPAAVLEIESSARERGIEFGISNFLRDLVEIRKSGLSPEKCVTTLSARNYGRLTPYLKVMARQLGWGLSFRRIYVHFERSVKSWLSRITMFLLLDTIHVGGGTPETLETLAQFSEDILRMEKEKRSSLRPLLIVPYIGAGILIIFTILFLSFSKYTLSLAGKSLGTSYLLQLLIPPLVFHVYNMGLVAGKISSEKVSAGFKHAAALTAFALIALLFSPAYQWQIAPPAGM